MPPEMPPAEVYNSPVIADKMLPTVPDKNWEHISLFDAVKKTLHSLPSFFRSDLVVSGVLATDLFNFNSSLGATIEVQVVERLNELRSTWDPDRLYTNYRFVRQSQQFPDVILRGASSADVILGIELKGWYALAKEGKPSFRYRVTPRVCAPQDLLVVYPWALSQVVSGQPVLFPPFVEGARAAALQRNHHWENKTGGGDNRIQLSKVDHYYPEKTEPYSDIPFSDNSDNFGRYARTGLMNTYITEILSEELSGIPLWAWQRFFKIFTEKATESKIEGELDQIVKQLAKKVAKSSALSAAGTQLLEHLQALVELLANA